MINLLYVVLMAMLALNISTEVLNGFAIVEESLNRTTANSSKENAAMYNSFEEQMKKNPEKIKQWFEKATQVKNMSDELFNFAQELKLAIARDADGEDADLSNIENKDNLESASHIMLAPGTGKGQKLFDMINNYRESMLKFVTDERQRATIKSNLSTEVPKNTLSVGKNWQEYMFENMPVAAAITLLSKLQSDVRYAEGEVLHSLISNVDVKDIRVNKLSAFVIPESKTVVRGDKFSARIVMAAVDTTQRPEIFIGGRKVSLRNNLYEFTPTSTGEFNLTGYITMFNRSGELIRRDFSQKYYVVDPSATVSADLMNVLYAGYDNPMSVSIPGVPLNAVTATMSGGSLRSVAPGKYIARPSTIGQDVTIIVSSNQTGKAQQMGKFTFHVRKLPDPTAYIAIGTNRFRGGGLAKSSIMSMNTLQAAIDDGLLDIAFRVNSFQTVFFDNMGNAVPVSSNGASFSQQQREMFRKMSRNKRFYITKISASGPDGTTRQLPGSMEIIVK